MGVTRTDCGSYVSRSTDETREFGCVLGRLLQAGDIVVLTGDLGAGKTQLTKGIAAGMGVTSDITSPTFTIQMCYEGDKLPLYHFDLYRLSDSSQLEDVGLLDVLGGDGPCVIEWGEQFVDELGEEYLAIELSRMDGSVSAGEEPPRALCLLPHGSRAVELMDELDAAVGGASAALH